jgi:hypothetical protein
VGACCQRKAIGRSLFALVFVFTVMTAFAATLHVPADYANIQAGIDAAMTGDTVLVAPGTYTGSGNRDIHLRGRDVCVIGSGGSSETIIDCQNSDRAFYIDEGETNAAVVEGFTIRNGFNNAEHTAAGGGIRVFGASPTLRALRVEDCASASWGGGVHLYDGSPIVEDLVITGCAAWGFGGGLSVWQCTVDLTGLVIFYNSADHFGGGIYLRNCITQLAQVTVVANDCAQPGGGIAIYGGYDVKIINSIVAYATAGGGIYLWGNAAVTVACCDVFENTGENYCGLLPDQTGVNGNISADPLFCDLPASDWALQDSSPCLPENNYCGVLMGALGKGGCTHPYLITGTVRDPAGQPLTGVRITGGPTNVENGADGVYEVFVSEDWSGTLTPAQSNTSFTPPSRSYTDVVGDIPAQDYLAIHDGVLEVPSQFVTIQEALDTAIDGDTVLAAPRTYSGPGNQDLELHGIDVVVLGSGGSSSTIIDCQHAHRAFDIHQGETSAAVVQGFTIRYGDAESEGGGVRVNNASPTLRDLRFEFCNANSFGGSVDVHDGRPVLEDILIRNGHSDLSGGGLALRDCAATVSGLALYDLLAYEDGGGLYIESSTVALTRSTLAFNECEGSGGGIAILGAGAVDISNSLVAFTEDGGGIHQEGDAAVTIACCDVYGNTGGDYLGDLADQTGVGGNISADPLFCDIANHDYTVDAASPCLPENNDCGVQMGAYGEGCDEYTGATEEAPPAVVTLTANHPNPFNPETAIRFGLPEGAVVDLDIFDVAGCRVATLLAGEALPAGWHQVTWRGRDDAGRALASGVYLYRLRADGQARVGKMTLLK